MRESGELICKPHKILKAIDSKTINTYFTPCAAQPILIANKQKINNACVKGFWRKTFHFTGEESITQRQSSL